MDISMEWIGDYVPVPGTAQDCAAMLSMGGIAVESVRSVGQDHVLSIEITANRSDCLSHLGIARELSALGGASLKIPRTGRARMGRATLPLGLEVSDRTLCPYYVARVIEGVTVRESPDWMKRRLASAGVRSINVIVDITNYVMLEIGQPLHAFDIARLSGKKIVVRPAAASEKIAAIDGREYVLAPEHLVIADGQRPVAVAGVIGGKESEIGSSTRSIVLESAWFNPESIRKTSRRLGIATESSYRFERGVTPEQVDWASRRAADLIVDLAGGTVTRVLSSPRKPVRSSQRRIRLRTKRVARIAGVSIPRQQIGAMLKSLQFRVAASGPDMLTVGVPPHRKDVSSEIDLVEEVVRLYGYNKIPSDTSMPVAIPVRPASERAESIARDYLVSMGLQEVLTLPFADPPSDSIFSHWSPEDFIALKDPQGKVDRWLRKSMAPGMLNVAAVNESYKEPVPESFEIARVYYRRGDRPLERNILCLMSARGFHTLKGMVQDLIHRLGIVLPAVTVPASLPFAEDESACWSLGEDQIGYLSLIRNAVREKRGVSGRVWIAEMDFEYLAGRVNLDRKYQEFPRTPMVRRDLALVVDDAVSWQKISETVMDLQSTILQRINTFDLYRGAGIPEGKKSIAFSLRFQVPDRTLTGEEVEAEVSRIVAALKRALGAELRS